jgi:hypothetical protein
MSQELCIPSLPSVLLFRGRKSNDGCIAMPADRVQAQPKENSSPANAERTAAQARTPESSAPYDYSKGVKMSGAASPDDISLTRDNLLFLQRTVGNRAVAQLLQKKKKLSQPGDEDEKRNRPEVETAVHMKPIDGVARFIGNSSLSHRTDSSSRTVIRPLKSSSLLGSCSSHTSHRNHLGR